MSNYIELEDYDRKLIDDSLRNMMKENDRSGSGTREELTRKYYQDINVTLFELRLKIQSPDLDSKKYKDLSLSDLKLIKSCLLGLDDSNHQKSLVEQDEIEYYKRCKLQMSALLEKISAMEQHTMYSGLL